MKVQLCSGWDKTPTALVFGELVNLAWPILTHYRSDLYHDAQWLEANLEIGKPFSYEVHSTGTNICLGMMHPTRIKERKIYYCELTLENGTHYLTIEETN